MEKERVIIRTSANRIDSMWGGKNKQRERRTGPEQEQEVRERTAKHKKKRLPPTLAIAKAGG